MPEDRENKALWELRSPLLENPQEEHQPALGKKGNSKSAYSYFILARQKETQTEVGRTPCRYALIAALELLAEQAGSWMAYCLLLEGTPSGRATAGPARDRGGMHTQPGSPRRLAGLTFLLRALTCCLAHFAIKIFPKKTVANELWSRNVITKVEMCPVISHTHSSPALGSTVDSNYKLWDLLIQPRLLHTKVDNALLKAIIDIQHFLK